MDNNNILYIENETSSISINNIDKTILLKTVSLLKEYMIQNENRSKELLSEINYFVEDYEFDESNFIKINYEDRAIEEKKRLTLLELEYNKLVEKNKELNHNIEQIKNQILNEQYEVAANKIKDKIQQRGIDLLKIQEQERNRIACDLHDSVVQELVNLMHSAEICIHVIDKDIISVKLDLQIMINKLKKLISEIRSIIYNLRPMVLEDLGLEVAVSRYLEQFEKENKIQVQFHNKYDKEILKTSVISITIFRVIQEACNNAVRHGNANQIRIDLIQKGDELNLSICDNGDGFDVEAIGRCKGNTTSGFGISIMKERICLLSGEIDIVSEKNMGTKINITIPVKIS